ncbi:MAG: glycoside hydrolase family 3 N-terminal domain-containing protein, partial [Pyrinomonadaceae bacterium]
MSTPNISCIDRGNFTNIDIDEIKALPIKLKVGQLFFIGIRGTEVDTETRKLLNEISPGGVCLFARNIKESSQTRELLESLNRSVGIVPFLSVDQEGGLVDRFRRIMPAAPAASKLRTIEVVDEFTQITAEALRIIGFNMDFAPVVDVIDDARDMSGNGMFSRAFGRGPKGVVELAGVFLNRLQEAGIIGCLKHFPGLGAARVDSHEELPMIDISEDELREVDLFPYFKLLRDGAEMVMVAHAGYPNLPLQQRDQDGRLLPSSLSLAIVTDLLKNELSFDGVVITDDLEMGAIVRNYGIGEACKMALNAGNDMLAICASEDAIREGFEA